MNPCHDDNLTPLDPAIENELYGMLARLCDGDLPASERDRMNEILNEHATARRLYLQYMALHGLLAIGAGGPVGCSVADTQLAVERQAITRFSEGVVSQPDVSGCAEPSPRKYRLRLALQWIAAVSAVLLVVAAFWQRPRVAGDSTENKMADLPGTSASEHQGGSELQQLVAEVTFVSDAPLWQNPNGSYAVASHVRSEQTLALERGQIELTYESGAKLMLTGPTEFLVAPKGGKLRRGELVARVPQAGHGFTIETPHGKVIDLGTEFGVVVDDFGVSQVSVFEGKVETLPLGKLGQAGDLIELTSGRAIQWTEQSVTPIAIHGKRYPVTPVTSTSTFAPRMMGSAINVDFRKSPPAPEQWTMLGDVKQSDEGLRLGSDPLVGRRPYLLSTREFNPAQGAVNIVCDVRFENARDAERASLAILTRSSNKQSKPNLPWSDMLARSFRCRFGTKAASGEGVLEAGTKFEADREITNISWGGFARPQPNTLYRLEMRDDGLNVTFTVSLVANPAIRKSIICRSLFRGDENFVAFEGSDAGTAIIERLAISQETSSREDASSLAEVDLVPSKQFALKKDITQQLLELVPQNAEVVLQDDFGGDSLDAKRWDTLGNIQLHDGRVQLGTLNADANIDTWRPRPYLLTRDHFDPARGALTVLGQLTFAENFLHGYGGSFAVMTRADSTYGGGPTWERSVLRQGIRFNFWPAAYGFDHSLEIHERSNPNAISLLTSAGLNISPQSRSYLFKATDDGQSATLTLIDPDQPQISKTITHSTTMKSGSSGVIAFESCWNSPVQLDNIRIYQAKSPPPETDTQKP